MKIGYLTHTLNPRTGAGVYSTALIDGVRAARPNAEIVVLTSEDLIPPSKWGILKNISKIREALSGCDVIHALDGFPYGVVAAVANRSLGRPLVITAVGTGAIQKLSHPVYGTLLRAAYRSAKIVTAPSHFIARELSKMVPDLAVKVVPHGVDPVFMEADSPLPSGINKPYILSVGSVKRRKGHHQALRAFAKIQKNHKNLSYVIVGNPSQSPEYFKELELIVSEEGLQKSVHFVHDLSPRQLSSLYSHAELFMLLPENIGGDVEGFGLVFLEAARAGLPVVASKGTSAEDAVQDERNGYLVDSQDLEEVSRAVLRVLENQSLRGTLSSESRAWAQEMSWDTQVKKYIDIYEKL